MSFRPVFTISIGDKHVDEKDTLTWTCEAFGIPDVKYRWLKNGEAMSPDPEELAVEDKGRYEIKDNVLIIRDVSINSRPFFCRNNYFLELRFSVFDLSRRQN